MPSSPFPLRHFFRWLSVSGAFVLAGSSLLFARQPSASGRWENSIRDYEERDKTLRPPVDGILFVGSSSIAGWRTLATDFESLPVIGRGFGGSMLSDAVFYVNRIVLPYRPQTIVIYSGSNDLAAGVEPTVVLAELKHFVAAVRAELPNVRLLYISNAPNPRRWSRIEKIREANALIAQYSATERMIEYVDVFSHMLGKDGLPRPELFIEDKLHMSAQGYALWTRILRPLLTKPGVESEALARTAPAGDRPVSVVAR